ncbi:HSP20-like chaperone [Fistulina hepatica ATCC 64428]|uniref:HSP20-like chaperone n=1 Tax=Fistulina hepatica ATCC 64428 TaxID=1128425 RepID=A0A0D7A4R2_9AGAR|nr:HSP20-like chaperone [Fistulina hepatica ATCC 64428]
MSVFYYEPFYDIDRFFNEAFNTFGGQRALQNVANTSDAPRALKPRMDLHEDSEKNLVTATFEFPGVPKEDVHIDAVNGRMTVSAETKLDEEREESGYAVRERRYGKWSRTLQLPTGVKEDSIKASMENGVLSVTFPKSTPEEAPKKITIA